MNKIFGRNSFRIRGKWIRRFGTGSSISLVLIAILTIAPLAPSHELAEAATTGDDTTVLTMDSTQSSAAVDLAVNSTDGTFASSAAGKEAKFSVTTNNSSGYNLSITGSDDNKQLINTSDGKVVGTLDSIPGVMSEATFDQSDYNGRWGYLPSKYDSASNNAYRPAPTKTATTLDATNQANATANEYTIALAARADYSAPAGTYTNTFTLNLVGNPVTYTISYADNSGDTVTNLPSATTGKTSALVVPIASDIPTRSGYTFSKWCQGTVADSGTSCTGTEYSPGDDFNISHLTPTNTTLYAVWTIEKYSLTINFDGSGVESVKVCLAAGDCIGSNVVAIISTSGGKIENLNYGRAYYLYPSFSESHILSGWSNTGDYGTLSCMASSTCTTDTNPTFTIGRGDGIVTVGGKTTMLAIQDVTDATCTAVPQQVYDTRDGQIYIIKKLNDGNCWMLDNLRLGAKTLQEDLSISNTNMDPSNEFVLPDPTYSGFTTIYRPQYNISSSDKTTTNFGDGSGKIGVYYNYCAASAGTYCMAENYGYGDAYYDICPAGWRMPTGGEGGEFQTLYTTYGSNRTNFRKALSVTFSGFFHQNSASSQGSSSYLWSSTYNETSYMYRLMAGQYEENPVYPGNRSHGDSVRCILKTKNPVGVETLQELGNLSLAERAAVFDNMTTDTAYMLTDSRDGQKYKVAKLADGSVWLLDNLRLGAATLQEELSTANTNMDANTPFTLPSSTSSDFNSYTEARINTSKVNTVDTTASKIWGDGTHRYGVYYNYCAVTAGTYCMSGGKAEVDASYDICPSGWRMPTGDNSGEYQALYRAYSSDYTKVKTALSVPLSGWFGDSSVTSWSEYGYAWTSTIAGGNSMFHLYVDTSIQTPTYTGYRYRGEPVRCIIRSEINDLINGNLTMQDIGNLSSKDRSDLVDKMTTGAAYDVMDSRDGQSYKISKLADGNVWLLDNLRLGSSTLIENLSTSNTNMSPSVNFKLPASSASGFNKFNVAMINTSKSNDATTDYGSGSGKIGVYYNYCAASAGTYCMDGNSTTGNAAYDICPVGWRMPTGGDGGEYQVLYTKYSSNTEKFRAALSTPLSGYMYDSSAYVYGNSGYFWSSIRDGSGSYMHNLYVDASYADTAYRSGPRTYGYSVRCLLK